MGKKILVVEDSAHVRKILVHMIGMAGAEVFEAGDGGEAMARLSSGLMPEAVVLDLMMPGVDGYALMMLMKQHPEWSRIPIVVCSARNQPSDIKKAKEFGASEYVVKPNIKRDVIISALTRVLGIQVKPNGAGATPLV